MMKYLDRIWDVLGGHRFNELERIIRAQAASRSDGFSAGHSLARLRDAPAAPLAVASCLPPDETGIATATPSIYGSAAFNVDLFAHYSSSADYLAGISDRRLENSNLRVYDLACIQWALAERPYQAQIFAIGNSFQNVPLVCALKRANSFPVRAPLWVQLHDGNCRDVLQRWCINANVSYAEMLERHYGVKATQSEELVSRGVYGVRALFYDVPLAGIIVHSQAARELVLHEMPDANVQVLFHPAVSLGVSRTGDRSGSLRIGTFGIPDDNKRTAFIIDAFRQLRRTRYPDAKLVIAGYDALVFAKGRNLYVEDGFEIYDRPPDEKLHSLMAGVDVAVQLRNAGSGESSGAIARLLRLDIPVITSPTSAFLEYGDAVTFLPREAGADVLADLIEREWKEPDARKEARARYVQTHSPQEFCKRLDDILALSAPRRA